MQTVDLGVHQRPIVSQSSNSVSHRLGQATTLPLEASVHAAFPCFRTLIRELAALASSSLH